MLGQLKSQRMRKKSFVACLPALLRWCNVIYLSRGKEIPGKKDPTVVLRQKKVLNKRKENPGYNCNVIKYDTNFYLNID